MIQTIVKPKQANFDMAVTLPDNYVGKEVYVLFYTDDELQKTTAELRPRKKPSDFFGIFSPDEAKLFDAHIQQARKQWDRNI